MRVQALLFATYRDMAGAETLDIELPGGATAGDLVARIRARPGMERLPGEPALAVNQVYSSLDTPLSEGDEVALLPPVAGG